MLLLRSVRSRLLLDHRAIAHSLQRCSKYEKIIVERLRRSENGNFITRKHLFRFTLTLVFDRPFSLVPRSLAFAKLFKLQLYSILHVNLNLNLNKLCGIQIINQTQFLKITRPSSDAVSMKQDFQFTKIYLSLCPSSHYPANLRYV